MCSKMAKMLYVAHDFHLIHYAAASDSEKAQDYAGASTLWSEAFFELRVIKFRIKAKSCGLRTGDFKGGFGFDSTTSDCLISTT